MKKIVSFLVLSLFLAVTLGGCSGSALDKAFRNIQNKQYKPAPNQQGEHEREREREREDDGKYNRGREHNNRHEREHGRD